MAELRSSFGSLRNCLLTNEPEQEKPEPRTKDRALQIPVLPSRSKGVGQVRGGVACLYAVDTPRVHVEGHSVRSQPTRRGALAASPTVGRRVLNIAACALA